MSRERTDSGQYAETVTIDRVRQVFSTVAGPAVTSADIASELGVTAEAARRKLNEFHGRGCSVNGRQLDGISTGFSRRAMSQISIQKIPSGEQSQ